ncbi:hypothetical protein M422DRAFT_156344 [Sphaerobolus stellatus SS14]|nr:hypothetical protein M422DRAFT_156344 [Sphaerobolus stellatus SS14]
MGRLTAWKWLSDQYATLPPITDYAMDLTGKTVIVTGANTGVGLATAQHLAGMKPKRLILACRNETKGRKAVETIRRETGHQAVETWSLNLADFASIKRFVDRFEAEERHLDLLVENAAVVFTKYHETVDGWEESIQVNHLGPSLLALLLLPSLLKAPVSHPLPRLVIVASEAHFFLRSVPEARSPRILEKLNDRDYFPESRSYISRLSFDDSASVMNVFFTRSLASRFDPPPDGQLTVTCVNPGFCKTELNRDLPLYMVIIMFLASFFLARTAKSGSRSVVWAALGGKPDEVHGRYTSRCRVEEENDLILRKEGAEIEERLWNETIEVLSKIDARVKSIAERYLNRR